MKTRSTATVTDQEAVALLGGYRYGGVTVTIDQMRQWARVYGVEMPKRPSKAIERWDEAGSARNLWRHAQHDGLRLMAFLARFLESGEDPVSLVSQLCAEAGWDMG